MLLTYTEEWNGFQFRSPLYLDGHIERYEFDLIKYVDHEPMEAINLDTGKVEKYTRHCFSIGTVIWDKKNESFEFKSCGLRYLEHRIDGLENFILEFCDTMKVLLVEEE